MKRSTRHAAFVRRHEKLTSLESTVTQSYPYSRSRNNLVRLVKNLAGEFEIKQKPYAARKFAY